MVLGHKGCTGFVCCVGTRGRQSKGQIVDFLITSGVFLRQTSCLRVQCVGRTPKPSAFLNSQRALEIHYVNCLLRQPLCTRAIILCGHSYWPAAQTWQLGGNCIKRSKYTLCRTQCHHGEKNTQEHNRVCEVAQLGVLLKGELLFHYFFPIST